MSRLDHWHPVYRSRNLRDKPVRVTLDNQDIALFRTGAGIVGALPDQCILAGLDVIEREPELMSKLRDNVKYAAQGLRTLGFDVNPQAGIIPLRVPVGMNIRQAAYEFHERGIFINSIEYPAVPVSQQRSRISLMATHSKADIDRLLDAVEKVWSEVEKGRNRLVHAKVA